ncbi:aldehyde dehydrogenase family protein [Streptomyces sp. NPDC094437]|uniref:aldehyde dehydrogenase family protein n=1 Tax=Streptomyces sp. NPDC094437 TaxID=3366060 RepID=UPI0038296272
MADSAGRRTTGGFFAEPTIFDRVAPDMRIAQEEIFNPVPSVFTGRSVRPRARAAATLAAAMSSPGGTLLRRNPLAPACSARCTYASLSPMPSSTLVTFAEAARIASVVRSPSRRCICRFRRRRERVGSPPRSPSSRPAPPRGSRGRAGCP